jgi:energy-coupling factor transport system ATP-binding protein
MSVSMKNVSASYGEEETWALKDISLEVNRGEVVGILGPTGSGKTTLFMTLKGILPHILPGRVRGQISIDGKEAITGKVAGAVGLVLPDPNVSIVALTVEDDVAFGPQCMGLPTGEIQKRVDESLELFRLRGYEKRVTYTLSGGESQATCVASIYSMKPRVFALDEPLSMIDPVGRETVLRAIQKLTKELGATVLIAESGDTIEYIAPICERFVVLNNGQKIADGPAREILQDRQLLNRIRIRPPQVTELAYDLSLPKDKVPLTVEEAAALISKLLRPSKSKGTESAHKVSQPAGSRIIEVRNLHHTFPGLRPVEALKGINLDINQGEMVGLIGQNGSGKTTLALHLVGIYRPTNPDAKVIVDGVELHNPKTPLTEVVKHINYVFQNPDNQLFSDTVEEEVTYALKMLDLPQEEINRKVDSILTLYGMQDDRKKPIMYLTKDKKTFLAQASVLVMNPKIIVVDEPTTGLDHEMGEKVMTILRRLNREENRTILIITHNMNLVAKYADRLVVMSNGQILLDGPTGEVFSKTDALKQCSISPPQITRLGQSLNLRPDVLTVEEMTDLLKDRVSMRSNP